MTIKESLQIALEIMEAYGNTHKQTWEEVEDAKVTLKTLLAYYKIN